MYTQVHTRCEDRTQQVMLCTLQHVFFLSSLVAQSIHNIASRRHSTKASLCLSDVTQSLLFSPLTYCRYEFWGFAKPTTLAGSF